VPFGPGDLIALDYGVADTRHTVVPHAISQFGPFVPLWLKVLSERHESALNPLDTSSHIGITVDVVLLTGIPHLNSRLGVMLLSVAGSIVIP